jgi:hypothetical protein
VTFTSAPAGIGPKLTVVGGAARTISSACPDDAVEPFSFVVTPASLIDGAEAAVNAFFVASKPFDLITYAVTAR